MGVPIYIPHVPISACYMGLIRVLSWHALAYGLVHTTCAHMGLLSGSHLCPIWACPYVLVRIEPIWVIYGRAHMGVPVYNPHRTHMDLLSG